MRELKQIFDELQSTSGKNDKVEIIKKNLGNREFVETMQFLMNPFILTGISTKKIKKPLMKQVEEGFNWHSMRNYLLINNSGKDFDIAVCRGFISTLEPELQDLAISLITKSLKLGVDSTWNKSVPDEYKVPEFDVMLAKKFEDHSDKISGNFVITKKLDGTRIILIKENGKVKSFSRTGQEYVGLEQIEEEFVNCPVDNMVWDGELLADMEGSTNEVFTETIKKSRTKEKGKTGLKFHVFDMLPVNEFKRGKSKLKAIDRKQALNVFFHEHRFNYSEEVKPNYVGDDISIIAIASAHAEEQGWEGVMINLDAPYECKRTSNLLKVKKMQSCDLKVLSIEEGEGKYRDMMGKCIVEYKGQEVGVGSGWTDEERSFYYQNPNSLIGKIIEVQYFEESTDSKTGKPSLRFPVFKCVRLDKTEPSYY